MFGPGRTTGHDGVCVDQQLSGAGDEGSVVSFAFCRKASVKADQGFVPSEGGWKRRGEERAPQTPPAASDAPPAFGFSTVVVEGSKTGEGCGLFTADAAELGHADDERKRGAIANARDAQYQIKAASEIVVSAQESGDVTYLGDPSCLELCNVVQDYAP
jgi:hypothetical protein